jgi:hypothetical protein
MDNVYKHNICTSFYLHTYKLFTRRSQKDFLAANLIYCFHVIREHQEKMIISQLILVRLLTEMTWMSASGVFEGIVS